MPGFRSAVWDPVLIIGQMATMQSIFYVNLGVWVFIMDFIVGQYRSLDQIFGYKDLQFKDFGGRLILGAFVLNALTGALGLWYVVKRTKLCLDFTCTVHFFHLIFCWAFTSTFPSTLTWWLLNIVDTVIMTVVGEFLCMRTELKAIPLNMGPRADL